MGTALPMVLTGHIIPSLTIASLIRVCPLCNMGCKVIFDNEKWPVYWFVGFPNSKRETVNLPKFGYPAALAKTWPLYRLCPTAPPIGILRKSRYQHCYSCALGADTGQPAKFAHQSLCNPKISTLLKAKQKGFFKGCPNISERLILRYSTQAPPQQRATWNSLLDMASGVQPPSPSRLSHCMSQSHPHQPRSQQFCFSPQYCLSSKRYLCIQAPRTVRRQVPTWLDMMTMDWLQIFFVLGCFPTRTVELCTTT